MAVGSCRMPVAGCRVEALRAPENHRPIDGRPEGQPTGHGPVNLRPQKPDRSDDMERQHDEGVGEADGAVDLDDDGVDQLAGILEPPTGCRFV